VHAQRADSRLLEVRLIAMAVLIRRAALDAGVHVARFARGRDAYRARCAKASHR
jgi:hypothetical protein